MAALSAGSAGAMFGTTQYGGGNDIDPDGKGGGVLYQRGDRFQIRHRFCALPTCADGAYPYGNLLTDLQGRVFGVTRKGGAYGAGVIYQFTP